ncbi:glycosyl hydrolase family 18 protein [Bacillus alkalicellulosilyticus]|uniref:glycosyl hydrolase family 18 protein n=1 Tax=Alkalihalobacterium alkalicellulosilyticum TaxID=1912214 RepID=UPI0009980429|nr:glycosyl hydrolase family 18 protein [Bacillus alkalicellulosilyticus]
MNTRKEKHKSSSNKATKIVGFLMTLAIILGGAVFFLYPFPSTEQVSGYIVQDPLIYNQQLYENSIFVKDETLYISHEFLRNEIDSSLRFDEKSKSIIITTKDKVIQIPEEELQLFVNEEPFVFEVPTVVNENDHHFIHLSSLSTVYPLTVEVGEAGAVFLYENGDVIREAQVANHLTIHESRLRTGPSRTTPYTGEVNFQDIVLIEREEEDYYYVRKKNGIAGYLHKDFLEPTFTERTIEIDIDDSKMPELTLFNEPINLTWEAVYTKTPDPASLPELPGVNVVSPTWFKLKNEKGDISNLGSTEYVQWAHGKEIQVWALFSNNFDPDLTHEALRDFETRQSMIRQLVNYAHMYNLDGINVDFENVYLEDGELVTQFMREATPYFHRAGLIVSMDVTFLSTSEMWSLFYDRVALSDIVDYMIVMAYDEHWATSPFAGSVASLPWVERNLVLLLDEIPHEKLILGIPLYTRIWTEAETKGGNIEVSSKALSMNQVIEWQDEFEVDQEYDEESGQHYLEYHNKEDKETYKIWIEDLHSLEQRVDIMKTYELAGIASWARNFGNDESWEYLAEILKK